MRRRGFTVWEALAVVVVISVLAAILWPSRGGAKYNARRTVCQSNLKQLSLALILYAQDNNNFLPAASLTDRAQSLPDAKSPYGWADALLPYSKENMLFQCPSDDTPMNETKDATQDEYTDYYLNANLSALKQEEIERGAATIMMGEGRDGIDNTDARYVHRSLPQHWIKDKHSPAWRHLNGANYAFADGHVKFSLAEKAKPTRSKDDDYSFAVR